MIKKLGIFYAAIVILAAPSCGKQEPWDEFKIGNVPESIKTDFYRRYSDSVIVKEANTSTDNTSRIVFTDTDGLPCTAIYKGTDWVFSQKEYDKDNFLFLNQLPRKIARAYIRAGIDGEEYDNDNSYVIEVSRRGFDQKAYEFVFTVAREDATYSVVHQEYSILVSADGDILDVQGSHQNRSIWWYDMDGCADFVRGRYPNAVIQAGINDCGDNVLYINDGGTRKKVWFDQISSNTQEWKETVHRLADDFRLPESVMEQYAEYRSWHPDFRYSEIYYVERNNGIFYGLKMLVNRGCVISETVYFKG